MEIQNFVNEEMGCTIACTKQEHDIWFRGKDIATILGYVNTKKAIIDHVDDDDKIKLNDMRGNDSLPLTFNEKQTIYINESGLYSLILGSKKEEAKQFQKWITSEILPSIRKMNNYTQKNIIKPQMMILNEYDLHINIVTFIKKYFPDSIIIPGLGELQDTSQKRCEAFRKGYVSGQADIMIVNKHKTYTGLAIELKTPKNNGIVSINQMEQHKILVESGFKVIISNDYTDIILQLVEYFNDVRFPCLHCCKCFKNKDCLKTHLKIFHRMN
jgi:prophage antirepressor-like protein